MQLPAGSCRHLRRREAATRQGLDIRQSTLRRLHSAHAQLLTWTDFPGGCNTLGQRESQDALFQSERKLQAGAGEACDGCVAVNFE